MTANTSKCPYCRRRYQQAAAYKKHLQAMHQDIVLFLRASTDQTSRGLAAVTHHENVNQLLSTTTTNCLTNQESDSDYESDLGLEITDCDSVGSETDNEIEHDPDTEDPDILPPDTGSPSSQKTILGAGRAIGDVAGYAELNQAMKDDPWSPFSSEDDFNLASWFVRSKVPKTRINNYFAKGLGGRDARSFQLAYTLQKHLDVLDPFGDYLAWTEGTMNDGRHTTTFYYRNIVNCVRYLIRQVAYRPDMVYAPVCEYNSSGERLYSEMHTADWWWDT